MFGANTNHGSFAVPGVCSSNMRGGFLSTLKILGSKKNAFHKCPSAKFSKWLSKLS